MTASAIAIIEAESPKKALKAGRWKLQDHQKGTMPREGWTYEIWYYRKGGFTFYLEAVDENPGNPPGHSWRIGLKQDGEDRWRTSGSLTSAMGEVQYGLDHEQALKRAIKWAEGNLMKRDGVNEAKGGESPKGFFQKGHIHRMGGQEVQEILQHMPEDFIRAYQRKEEAEWQNPYVGDYDWWPSYDEDREEENPWTEYVYYWDFATTDGKLFGIVMSGDRDGNHDSVDQAEVGTKEYHELENRYSPAEWQKAMNEYYRWVVEHRKDPLGYIMIRQVEVKKEWIAAFKRDGNQLRLVALRRKKQEPPSKAISGEQLAQLAKTDPDVRQAIDYCVTDPDTLICGIEEKDIIEAGGKWDNMERLIIHFEIEDKERAANYEDELVRIAGEGIREGD